MANGNVRAGDLVTNAAQLRGCGVQGASGQALQNMNLIMGMPEETGLMQQAMFP
jgi:hypothetical protein